MRKFPRINQAIFGLVALIGLLFASAPALSQTTPNGNIVQEAVGNCDGCNSATATFSRSVTGGDGIVIFGYGRAGFLSGVLPTDLQGDTFSLTKYVSSGQDVLVYVQCNAIGGTTAITLAGGSSYTYLHAFEIQGQPTTGCGDASGSLVKNGSAATSPLSVGTSSGVSQANELVFGSFSTIASGPTTSLAAGPESTLLQFGSGTASSLEPLNFLTEVGNTLTGLSGVQTLTATMNANSSGAGATTEVVQTIKLTNIITGSGGQALGASVVVQCASCIPVHVNLSWATAGTGMSYNVYESPDGTTYTKIAGGLVALTYTDTATAIPGENSFYEVTASDSAGNEGAKSAPVSILIPTIDNLSATIPTPPSPVVTSGTLTESAISVTAITANSATVNWTTSVAADSQVGYAVSPSTTYKFTTCCAPSNTTSHSVVVSGLSAGTTYNFVVDSTMTAAPNTEVVSNPQQFTTTGASTLTLSNVAAGSISQTGAVLTWNSTVASSSRVGYAVSPSTSYTFTTVDNTQVTAHSVTVNGLVAGTAYNYIVESIGGVPSATVDSANSTFTTSPASSGTGPAINCITASGLMTTSATITWTTDKLANSQVLFAIAPATSFTSTAVSDTAGVTLHIVTLSGLQSGTTYNYEVKSVGTDSTTSTSTLQQFTTAGGGVTPPLTLSNVAATNVTTTGATITWTSSAVGSSQVGFAVSPSTTYTKSTLDNTQVSAHTVVLTGLAANTTYNYVAISGAVQSSNFTFTTLANSGGGAFTDSNITVTGITTTGATVNWTTPQAADSQVGYSLSPSTTYQFTPCCSPSNVTSHTVVLTGLQSGKVYNFVVDSTMTAAPKTEVVSPNQQFTTLAAGGTGGGPQALAISGFGVTGVTTSGATLVWSTNNAADTQVGTAISPSTSYVLTTLNTTKATSHSVAVSGLVAGTTYNYIMKSNDGTTSASVTGNFVTTATTTGGGGTGTPGTDCNVSQSGCTGPAGSVKAFPSAQGGGAQGKGGRGGVVIEITNLNNSGTGSLRQCAETSSGARNCIFRISGLSTNASRVTVKNPFITIAGQTAPGGPFMLGGPGQSGESLDVQTHDVTARYLSYDGIGKTGPDGGTVGFEMALGSGSDVFNVVFDHLSVRRTGNKVLLYANDSSDTNHIFNNSWQWSLIMEPNIQHPVGPLLSAITDPIRDTNNDFHHDMYANIGHRLPLIAPMENTRLVSNLTFNWDYFAVNHDGSHLDMINNNYIKGNLNSGNSNPHPLNATLGTGGGAGNCLSNCNLAGTPSDYMSGNVCEFGTDYQCAAAEAGTDPEGFAEVSGAYPTGWRRASPLAAEPVPIVADSAASLPTLLTPTVGNSQHLDCNGNWVINRDAEDKRVIAQFNARGPGGEYGIPNDPSSGFYSPSYNGLQTEPAIAAGTPCQESLHDGIPDQWKSVKGLSLSDATLYKTPAPNGYTYLENYLNGTDPKK